MIKQYMFCVLLFAALVAFGVNSFAVDTPSGDRFFTVDENGFIVDESEQAADEDSSTTEKQANHVIDSGVPPTEPPIAENNGMYFIVTIFMVAMIGGILLCMIFFDRL